MRVLLVSFYNTEAYGIRSIHTNLISMGVDAKMLFFKTEIHKHEDVLKKSFHGAINEVTDKEICLFTNFILSWKPDIIGFGLVSSHFHLFKQLQDVLRKMKVKIIVGGWEPSLNPKKCIEFADYVCVGEGEEALSDLILCLEKGETPKDIKNLWIKTADGCIRNPVRTLNRNLSELPIPLFEDKYCILIENDQISFKDPYIESDRYGTFIGRGCPYRCTYCSNSYMAENIYPGTWSKIRFNSTERMRKELLEVKRKFKNIKTINFYDEVFSSSVEWSNEFFSWYRAEIGIPFCCTFFPGRCSDDLCKVLSWAGMKGVWLGVQSGSERVRREIFKRHYTNKAVLEQAKIFHQHHVSVRYDFIFDNPFETFEETLESIRLMLEFPQPFSINAFSLKFFPNTQITETAKEKKIITEQDVDDCYNRPQDNYKISGHANNKNQEFINRLVTLISCLAKNGQLDKNKIEELILNFITDKKYDDLDNLLRPFVT